jgi:hypothetical protein
MVYPSQQWTDVKAGALSKALMPVMLEDILGYMTNERLVSCGFRKIASGTVERTTRKSVTR